MTEVPVLRIMWREYGTVPTLRVEYHKDHLGDIAEVHGEWRCTFCGHRLTVNGIPPRATRTMPPWRWMAELLGRYDARRMHGRQGDQGDSPGGREAVPGA